jgi:hypothetical protein
VIQLSEFSKKSHARNVFESFVKSIRERLNVILSFVVIFKNFKRVYTPLGLVM